MALANLSIYYTWKNIKSEQENKKFKISAPTWNDTFDLPDGSYSISAIDYFEFIIKKHKNLTENPPVQIYPNEIKNRIVFEIKTGYKLKLLTPETTKLLGSTKKKKMLIKIKMEKPYQHQKLLKLFQCIVIQSKMITSTHQNFYLVLFQTNNLDSS